MTGERPSVVQGPGADGGHGEPDADRPCVTRRLSRVACRPLRETRRPLRGRGDRSGDRGSGTVLLVGVVAVAVVLMAATGLLVGAERSRATAQAAADLAALAAAAALDRPSAPGDPGALGDPGAPHGGGAACAVAAAVAGRNGARLVSCTAGAGGVVSVSTARAAAGAGVARASARAGPAAARGDP